MATSLSVSVVTCFFSLFLIHAQQVPVAGQDTLLSRVCLGCICEAASGCNVTIGCEETVCGPFRITWAYWADGGKPSLDDNPNAKDMYARCVNDPYCAARTVQGYMTKYSQDCNGDGIINCDDFARIHHLGGYGCSGGLNAKYENAYKLCMQTFDKQ
ncbi:lysozyme-like [Ceratina calcarata]|uniref:lysozyme n=1 Tax=Ceratina calcarata TaxID=156304 RepID=A0AAJ7J8C0_9HYME|nr:lysozyme-like [Ceratina calcarata]